MNTVLKNDFEKLYTAEEVATMLRLHVKTVQGYIREGKLKAVKVGRAWRVTEGNLQKYYRDTFGK